MRSDCPVFGLFVAGWRLVANTHSITQFTLGPVAKSLALVWVVKWFYGDDAGNPHAYPVFIYNSCGFAQGIGRGLPTNSVENIKSDPASVIYITYWYTPLRALCQEIFNKC